MATLIDMPKLSDTMTVGTLVRWLKQEGDAIRPGDLIAEVETDKATMELENFESGVLLRQYVQPGAQVSVGDPICAVGQTGETPPEPGAHRPAPQATSQEPTPPKADSLCGPEPLVDTTPRGGESTEVPTEQGSPLRIKASPLAKKIAHERGISLQSIGSGSGPGGRIVRADVEGYTTRDAGFGQENLQGATPSAGPIPQSPPLPAAADQESSHDELLPVSGMRATIARRLLESKTQVPHFYLQAQIDAEPMIALRRTLNEQLESLGGEEPVKLTVNDFILRACAVALAQHPGVNSSWLGSHIQQHGSVHLAFGVALADGLVTPIIRDAQHKSLKSISLEAKSLIRKAKDKKLSPRAMSGSTFTVTNLGMFGIDVFYGIINPPNAGILAVGRTVATPVVDKHGHVVAGHRMTLGFSGDHRVIDGAVAAQFLGTLRHLLENPALMLI